MRDGVPTILTPILLTVEVLSRVRRVGKVFIGKLDKSKFGFTIGLKGFLCSNQK